jgi:NAD(P)H-dependent FMN reductase
MPLLLIAWHSRTGASAALAAAAEAGAQNVDDVDVRSLPVADIDPANLLAADAYLFIGPENLGALSGAMKELLDRCYYPLLGRVEGRPYGHIIAAGSDGSGAARQLARIITGWRLRPVMDPMIVNLAADTPAAILAEKHVPAPALIAAREAGALFANGLALGIF